MSKQDTDTSLNCTAITKLKTRCTRKAVADNLCKMHSKTASAEKTSASSASSDKSASSSPVYKCSVEKCEEYTVFKTEAGAALCYRHRED